MKPRDLGTPYCSDHNRALDEHGDCPVDGAHNPTPNAIKPKLKLLGKDGNAFAILGAAGQAARKAGWQKEKITEYTEKAMSGDYNHLLIVTMEYFDVS